MKKYFSAILIFCACSLTSAAAQNDPAMVKTDTNVSLVQDTRGYLLGIGDEIEVKVLGEPDFGGNFTVDEDGKIQLPFVNTPVSVTCHTDRELRTDITTLLKKYLRDPQVNVRVTEKRSRPPAMIYGEVKAPQQFDMRRSVKLLELLSYTGGTTEQASGLVEIIHTKQLQCAEPGETVNSLTASNDPLKIPSQIYRLSDIRDGKTDANPIVRPGDIITVLSAAPVYIIGEVRAPNKYTIPERGLTLTDAVAMAYGLNERAKKKEIRVYRLKKGSSEREMLSYNLDLIKKGQQPNVTLQPFDIVEVEKAPKSIAQTILEYATGAARTATTSLPLRVIP
ncbi:MAG: polysaccharide biosynthesis/export family protein [Pyrinomonadaceae bacterium]